MTVRVPLATLVERFGGQCAAPLDREVIGFATLDEATENHIAFVAQPRFRSGVPASRAAAILVTAKDADALASSADRLWVCKDPYLQFARIAQWFDAANHDDEPSGVHPTAVVDASASVGEGASVGPHAVVGARARIGAGARIDAGCSVGADSRIGDATRLHPNVTVYHGCTIGSRCILHAGAIVGADGFGFAKDGKRWEKIPQTGGVVIGDDVEIGANTTIDRGALSDTVIGRGVKLDNQIQVAHNVKIGEDTIMAAFVGIAGSAVIGARCMIGGAARIMGHVTIADDVVVSTQTFVSRSITKPGQYTGYYPMSEHASFEKNAAVLRRLDQLRDRVRSLEIDARDTEEPPEPEGHA